MKPSSYAGSHQTVRISAKRFEQSPFWDCYGTPDTILGIYARRFYPLSDGSDPTEKYWTLRRKAMLYDVPERPIRIEGPDSVAFLEHLFTRPIATLKIGRGRYAIACTAQGGILMDGILFKLAEQSFWYVQADGEFGLWLDAQREGFDVTISDPRSRVLQLQGPNAPEIMALASGGTIDSTMGYFHAGYFDLGGQELFVSRTGWTGELGYEIYTQGHSTDCPALWQHLLKAGEPFGMEVGSLDSMGIRRIEAGILDNGTDMDPSMTPFQAGLGPFVDLDKTDFIGRDALHQADKRVLLFGLKCNGGTPQADCAVLDGEQRVGRITAGGWSPFLKTGIGYVRFTHFDVWLEKSLVLETRDGQRLPCKIVDLPFYDPDKKIPRGLEALSP